LRGGQGLAERSPLRLDHFVHEVFDGLLAYPTALGQDFTKSQAGYGLVVQGNRHLRWRNQSCLNEIFPKGLQTN
jgi:hypothetical protein